MMTMMFVAMKVGYFSFLRVSDCFKLSLRVTLLRLLVLPLKKSLKLFTPLLLMSFVDTTRLRTAPSDNIHLPTNPKNYTIFLQF